MVKNSVGRTIGASILAAFLGMIAPVTLAWATPIIGVADTWLYAWAGVVPATVFAVCGATAAYFLGGGLLCGGYVLAVLVPAAAALWAIHKKLDYKQCMRISVFTQVGAVVLALGLVWLILRTNLVDLVIGGMVNWLKSFPSEMMDSLLMAYGSLGLFGATTGGIDYAKGFLLDSERILLIEQYGKMAADAFKIALAGMLLTSSVLTGVLNVAVPSWIWARRADERGIRRLPVSEWRVPAHAAIGLPVVALVCYILAYTGYPGGEAAYYAVWELFKLLLRFQCLGVISRIAKKNGMGKFLRGLLLFAAMTFASGLASLVGGFSLYLGSHGLITEWLRKRKKNREGDQ